MKPGLSKLHGSVISAFNVLVSRTAEHCDRCWRCRGCRVPHPDHHLAHCVLPVSSDLRGWVGLGLGGYK